MIDLLTLLLAGLFLPLFPLSMGFNFLLWRTRHVALRVLLLLWPLAGLVLLRNHEIVIPDWIAPLALFTSALYAFRALALRDMQGMMRRGYSIVTTADGPRGPSFAWINYTLFATDKRKRRHKIVCRYQQYEAMAASGERSSWLTSCSRRWLATCMASRRVAMASKSAASWPISSCRAGRPGLTRVARSPAAILRLASRTASSGVASERARKKLMSALRSAAAATRNAVPSGPGASIVLGGALLTVYIVKVTPSRPSNTVMAMGVRRAVNCCNALSRPRTSRPCSSMT